MVEEVSAIAPPKTRGADARAYLESHGLVARIPTIRASDEGIIECPFLYYLQRRLGLGSALRWGEALNRGSWAHRRLEAIRMESKQAASHMSSALTKRLDELRGVCKTLDLSSESTLKVLDREEEDAKIATAWIEASTTYTNPTSGQLAGGWLHYFDKPYWHFVASEVVLSYKHPAFPKTISVVQLDWMLLNTETNLLWVLDMKTTSKIPYVRAQMCTVEFQPQHYLHVVDALLKSGELQAKYDLPPNTKLGGMIHLIIGKPTISFGQKDRAYSYSAESKRAKIHGTAKRHENAWLVEVKDVKAGKLYVTEGLKEEEAVKLLHTSVTTIPKKTLYGEPDPIHFQQRCANWYQGVGDYAHERTERLQGKTAPVCISTTQAAGVLDSVTTAEYHARLNRIYKLATAVPFPANFVRTHKGMETLSGLNDYADFFVCPVRDWPEIVRRKNFIQAFRDEDLTQEAA